MFVIYSFSRLVVVVVIVVVFYSKSITSHNFKATYNSRERKKQNNLFVVLVHLNVAPTIGVTM